MIEMKRKGLENILGTVALILTIAGLAALLVAWFSGFVGEMQGKGGIQSSEERGKVAEDLAIEAFDGTHLVMRNIGITDIMLTKNGNTIISLYRDTLNAAGYVYQSGLNWEIKNDAGNWVAVGTDTMLAPGRLMRVSGNNLFPFNSRYQIMTEKEVRVIFGQGIPNIMTVTANPSRIPSNDYNPVTHQDESVVAAIIMDLYGNPITGQQVEFTILEPNPFDGIIDGHAYPPGATVVSAAGGAAQVILQGDHDMTVRVRATLVSNPTMKGEVRVVVYGTTIVKRNVRAVVYSNATISDSSCSNMGERAPTKYYMDPNGTLTVTKVHCPMRTILTHRRYIMFEVDLRGTTEEIPQNAIITSVKFTLRHWENYYNSFNAGRSGCGTYREGIGSSCTPATHGSIYSTCWYQYTSSGTTYYIPTGYPIGPGYYAGTGAYANYQYRWWSGSGCSSTSTWADLDDRTNDDVWVFYLDHSIAPHDATNPYKVNGVDKEDAIVNSAYIEVGTDPNRIYGNLYPEGPNEPAGSKTVGNLHFTRPDGVPLDPPDIISYINTPDDANHFALAVYFAGNVMPTGNYRYSLLNINYVQVTIVYRLPGAVMT